MNIVCFVRPAPGWNKFRFNLTTGAVEVPQDVPLGVSAFGEGTWVLHPADRAALDAAAATLQAAAGADGTLTVVAVESAVPDAAETVLREALARGATRAVLVTGARDPDSYVTASALAAVIGQAPGDGKADLVLLGADMPGGAPDEIGPMVAEDLGWAQITAALTLIPAPDDPARLRADQQWVAGLRTVEAALPLVVSLLPNAALTPRYPQGGAVLAAYRKGQIERVDVAVLGLTGANAAQGVRRVIVRRAALGEAHAAERLTGPVEESVAVLLPALRQS
jgi:electron transfer flavoprotein beta subunit